MPEQLDGHRPSPRGAGPALAPASAPQRWSIVLAGGEGERLRPWVESLIGKPRPKQYCSFLGQRSMLEHTLARARAVSEERHIVTVIGAGHPRHLAEARIELPGRVVEQPANLDTAPGVLLPLSYVLAQDPEAAVAVFPSDHFIAPNGRFLEHVERAFLLCERLDKQLILLGAVPDGPEPEYGWIQPEAELRAGAGAGVHLVSRFREKPEASDAAAFFRDGYLWNTFIMVAKAKTLWRLAGEQLPEVQTRFDALIRAIDTPKEAAVLNWVYGATRPANFSAKILENCADRTLVLMLDGVEWSDWGRPERIQETLRKAGRGVPRPSDGAHALAGLRLARV